MIETIHGPMPENRLRRKQFVEVNNQFTKQTATEWYLGQEMVRRDVHVDLKQGLGIEGILRGP